MTSYVSASSYLFGERVKNEIYNMHATTTLYLTYFRIVGNAIDCPNPSTVEYPEDADIEGEIKPFELDVPWLSVENYALNYAKFLGEYLNATDPFPIIQIDTRPEYQFSGDLFDKIGLSLEKYGISASDYRICKIEHDWKAETGQSIITKWYTEKRAAAASGGDSMVNGDFETGNLTNWTTSGSVMSVISTTKYEGTYSLLFDTISSTAGTQSITSARRPAIGDQTYAISLATMETYTPDDLHTIQCDVTKIAYVDSKNPTTNFHNQNIVGGYTGGSAFRALYQFDLSAIPSGAIVTNAILKNTLTNVDSQIDTNITLYRNIAAWSDTTVTWNTKPAYEPTGIGSKLLLSNESNGVKNIDLASAYVNELLSTWTNNGFTLVAAPEGGTVVTTKTVYWREYYIDHYATKPYFNETLGGWLTIKYPVYAYRIKSKTYTVSSSTSNKYTFNSTPYITLTYNTISYPFPHYNIYIKWYNAASGGNLIKTDTICSENQQSSWNIRSIQLNSPTNALSYEIQIVATRSDATFYVDDIQVIPLGYY